MCVCERERGERERRERERDREAEKTFQLLVPIFFVFELKATEQTLQANDSYLPLSLQNLGFETDQFFFRGCAQNLRHQLLFGWASCDVNQAQLKQCRHSNVERGRKAAVICFVFLHTHLSISLRKKNNVSLHWRIQGALGPGPSLS